MAAFAYLLVLLSVRLRDPMTVQSKTPSDHIPKEEWSVMSPKDNKKTTLPIRAPLSKMPKNLEDALDILATEKKNIPPNNLQRHRPNFIQIGANDGQMYDPLYPLMKTRHHLWNGLLVEPQPNVYGKLVALHRDKINHWAFYNGLLTSMCQNGRVRFCEAIKSGESTWWREQGQANSLNMKHCANSDSGASVKYVRVERPCVRDLEELIAQHGPGDKGEDGGLIRDNLVDLLQIDTEAHDFEIIQGINFDAMIPRCIHYEASYHGIRAESVPFLEKQGYTIIKTTRDDLLACQVENTAKFA